MSDWTDDVVREVPPERPVAWDLAGLALGLDRPVCRPEDFAAWAQEVAERGPEWVVPEVLP